MAATSRNILAACVEVCESVEAVSLEQYFKPVLSKTTRALNNEVGTFEELTAVHAFVHARRSAKSFIEELNLGSRSRYREIWGICMNLPCQEIEEE